jgi:hypothetical protein
LNVQYPVLMKKALAILLLFFTVSFFSCKKYVAQQEQNAAINIITNGVWYVEQYLQNGTDITSSLSSYNFQFRSDGTVTGTSGSISITGTWTADITSKTITSSFPTGSGPLNNLDAVWKITDSSVDYVVANTSLNSNTNNLRLQKR